MSDTSQSRKILRSTPAESAEFKRVSLPVRTLFQLFLKAQGDIPRPDQLRGLSERIGLNYGSINDMLNGSRAFSRQHLLRIELPQKLEKAYPDCWNRIEPGETKNNGERLLEAMLLLPEGHVLKKKAEKGPASLISASRNTLKATGRRSDSIIGVAHDYSDPVSLEDFLKKDKKAPKTDPKAAARQARIKASVDAANAMLASEGDDDVDEEDKKLTPGEWRKAAAEMVKTCCEQYTVLKSVDAVAKALKRSDPELAEHLPAIVEGKNSVALKHYVAALERLKPNRPGAKMVGRELLDRRASLALIAKGKELIAG